MLEIFELLDGINIQKIIDTLEQQPSLIIEQNNPIVEALMIFDENYLEKHPEHFDLIIKIRKRILE